MLALILAAHLAARVVLHHLFPVEQHLPVGRRVHAGDDVERRGLAGAVGADKGHDLALIDLHAQIVHGYHTAELHGHIFHAQHVFRLTHCTSPPFAALLRVKKRPIFRMSSYTDTSRVPMMPLRKNSTTIMISTENTTMRKP